MSARETAGHLIDGFGTRARAYVQVQNGCDHRCTFCIIPYARGNSRSVPAGVVVEQDRKSTRLNSSHVAISYAVFCLKKKTTLIEQLVPSVDLPAEQVVAAYHVLANAQMPGPGDIVPRRHEACGHHAGRRHEAQLPPV